MNTLKKAKQSGLGDLTSINAAALQDHYLRSVNINIKLPTGPRKNNPIIKKLKLQEQRSEMLQQMREESKQINSQEDRNDQDTNYSSKNSNPHTYSDNPSASARRRTSNSNIKSEQSSLSKGENEKTHIRVAHNKVLLQPVGNQPHKTKKQFLPPLPHEIDKMRAQEEQQQDKVKMAKYLNKLTLAQRLGIVAAPPKPLTREDWVEIEEQSKKREEGTCPICLDDFKDTTQIILSCSHVFHKKCLESFEKHNKVNTCPICRRADYDKKQWDDGYKKYIVKCALLLQKWWRGSKVREAFFKDLIARKYDALSVRLRRKILGRKLGKFNDRVSVAIKQRRAQTNKVMKQFDTNIKKHIEEMYSQMNQIQKLKQQNQQEYISLINQQNVQSQQIQPNSINNYAQISEQMIQEIYNGPTISDEQWNQVQNKALERADKDCAICFNNLFLKEHLQQNSSCESHNHNGQCCQNSNKNNKNQQKGLFILSCTHVFHANCLSAFERYNLQENQVCPICRSKYQKKHFILSNSSNTTNNSNNNNNNY